MRTNLLVVPAKVSFFSSLATSHRIIDENEKYFAIEHHEYSHLSVQGMVVLCEQSGVLTPSLEKLLKEAPHQFALCKTSGGPRSS